MGHTMLYNVVQPMGFNSLIEYGLYNALENYFFPMTHGLYNIVQPMGHGLYNALADCIFPMGHELYGALVSYLFEYPYTIGIWPTLILTLHGSYSNQLDLCFTHCIDCTKILLLQCIN